MKTLDEVIEAQERCGTYPNCHFCYLHSGLMCEWIRDALHYLKEYRSEKAMWEADRKGYLNWIEQYKEAREKHQQAVIEMKKNPPLTWDELKAMEGKPVWIWISPRVKNTPGSGHWAIVYRFNPIGGNKNLFEMQMENGSRYKRKYQGDLWQAYRKERK